MKRLYKWWLGSTSGAFVAWCIVAIAVTELTVHGQPLPDMLGAVLGLVIMLLFLVASVGLVIAFVISLSKRLWLRAIAQAFFIVVACFLLFPMISLTMIHN